MKYLIGLMLLSTFTMGQSALADLSSPRATIKTFLQGMKRVKQGDAAGYEQAMAALQLQDYDPATRVYSGKLAAQRIIKTIDRIRYVDYQEIPLNPKSSKWIFEDLGFKGISW